MIGLSQLICDNNIGLRDVVPHTLYSTMPLSLVSDTPLVSGHPFNRKYTEFTIQNVLHETRFTQRIEQAARLGAKDRYLAKVGNTLGAANDVGFVRMS